MAPHSPCPRGFSLGLSLMARSIMDRCHVRLVVRSTLSHRHDMVGLVGTGGLAHMAYASVPADDATGSALLG